MRALSALLGPAVRLMQGMRLRGLQAQGRVQPEGQLVPYPAVMNSGRPLLTTATQVRQAEQGRWRTEEGGAKSIVGTTVCVRTIGAQQFEQPVWLPARHGLTRDPWVGMNPNHGGPNRTARSIGKSAVTSVMTMLQGVSLSMPR